MVQPLLDIVSTGLAPGGGDVWLPDGEPQNRAPPAPEPRLAAPGPLTARQRAADHDGGDQAKGSRRSACQLGRRIAHFLKGGAVG